MQPKVTRALRRPTREIDLSTRLQALAHRMTSAPGGCEDPALEWYQSHGHGD